MVTSQGSAQSQATWLSDDSVRLDHVVLTEADAEWLRPARCLTAWAVKVPVDFYRKLPLLEWLDVRGGSAQSVDFLEGCSGLRYLAVNQVRGVHDLTTVGDLVGLELLSVYGLPQVRSFPSLKHLTRLRRAEVGSMKGLEELAPLLDAPALEELLLIRAVSMSAGDPALIAEHPTVTAFDWFAEDVPNKTWVPVVERVGKPKTRALHPEEWFRRHT